MVVGWWGEADLPKASTLDPATILAAHPMTWVALESNAFAGMVVWMTLLALAATAKAKTTNSTRQGGCLRDWRGTPPTRVPSFGLSCNPYRGPPRIRRRDVWWLRDQVGAKDAAGEAHQGGGEDVIHDPMPVRPFLTQEGTMPAPW